MVSSDDISLDVDKHQESWLSGWFKWCPTSQSLLREAERNILHNIQTPYKGRYIDVGACVGNEKNYIWTFIANEESDKTPLVLLHGFGAGIAFWCLNFDSLAKHRPVYACDILGFGRSSRPTFTSDAVEAEKEFITSIEHWRAVLGLEKFILLGHSFGGFLGASYAIKHPERIEHLILADPWGFPEKPLKVGERYRLPFWARIIGTMAQPFNPLSIIRTLGPLGPMLLQRVRPDLTRKFSNLVPNAEDVIPGYVYHLNAQHPSGESAFHSMMAGFGWARYPLIHRMDALNKTVPITLIYGSRSWVDRNPGFQLQYMRRDSFVDVQIISAAGHHVYADRAMEFNSLINRIGSYVDEGVLPPVSVRSTAVEREQTSTYSFDSFINVNQDLNTTENQTQNADSTENNGMHN